MTQKRKKAVLAILAAIIGTGIVTAHPTPDSEISKQIFIAVANVAMCVILWDIYFDEKFAKSDIKSYVSELGLITLSSVVTAFIVAKAITTFADHFMNWFGGMGWSIAGLLAASVTGFLGMGWTLYCDDLYRNPK
jgi:drug/metabolite transporter (DMT)-like permease